MGDVVVRWSLGGPGDGSEEEAYPGRNPVGARETAVTYEA
jgi:hypothetical protein